MAQNRLNLDFSLESMEERVSFVRDMVSHEPFVRFPLTPSEAETVGSYILWGKNKTGQNAKQSGEVQLESKNHTWDAAKREESLDALQVSPSFQESSLRTLSEPPTPRPRALFSRKLARELCPPHLKADLEALWRQIDETDLVICYYDLAHNRRKTDPRPELIARFDAADQDALRERAENLNQFKYLKLRHLLVELRQQQYTLSDSWIENHTSETIPPVQTQRDPGLFGADLYVAPVGIISQFPALFPAHEMPTPQNVPAADLGPLLKSYWDNLKCAENAPMGFDFRNQEHLYQLFQVWDDFQEQIERGELQFETSKSFFDTLQWYINQTELSEVQEKILDLKIKHKKNQDIADIVNRKYGHSYNANYISTIFCQKILGQIAATAERHQRYVENLCFVENWKECSRCGRYLLVDSENFMRKARSTDGYSSRCKRCDREVRLEKKAKQESDNGNR